MKRFFVEQLSPDEKIISITGKEFHHLKNVLRLNRGDEIIVFDGKGLEFSGKIESIGKHEARIAIEKQVESIKESGFEIILCQGLAKSEKMELIIQKATELGVSRILPFITNRVVPSLDAKQIGLKIQRWRRIALEAAKQCRRSIVPRVEEPKTFTEILKGWDNYIKIILWEEEKKNSLKDILKKDRFSGCIVLIGPEGGFSEVEVAEAKKAGFVPAMLGPRILRTETAAIGIVAIIQYELGDIGLSK